MLAPTAIIFTHLLIYHAKKRICKLNEHCCVRLAFASHHLFEGIKLINVTLCKLSSSEYYCLSLTTQRITFRRSSTPY